jgi:phage antirepressor YoqD-like protein
MKQINMKDYTGKNYLVDGCVVRALDNLYVSTDINELFGGVDVATHCAETYNGKNYSLIYFYDDKAVRQIAKKSGMEHLLPDLGITDALVPVHHEEVEVCGERVLAAVTEDGKAYFSPRHVCDALGIDWPTQFRKIMADEVLKSTVGEMTTVAADGKKRVQTMIPIEFANGWLFTIKKVRPELQAKLNLFRAEAFLALDAWFRQGLRNDPEVQAKFDLPKSLSEALRAYADEVEKNERLAAANKVLAPRAAYHVGATKDGGEYYLREVARSLGTTHIQLSRFLVSKGVFYARRYANNTKPSGYQTRNVPKAQYVAGGYFNWGNGSHSHGVTYTITQKGVRFIAELLYADGLIDEIPAWAKLHEEAA